MPDDPIEVSSRPLLRRLAMFSRGKIGNSLSRLVFAVTTILMMVASIHIRGHIIAVRIALNPDEGELMAAGRRAAMSIIPFNTFTTNTYGPVWPWLLGVLHRLGMPLTLPMAHLLSALVVGISCSMLVYALWRAWNIVVAIVTITPIFFQWCGGFFNNDFLSLSTELLPITIFVFGCAVAFPRHRLSLRRSIIAAVLLGATAWTKYHLTLLVVVALIALVVKMFASGHRLRTTVAVCLFAPFSVLAAMVAWALLGGVPLWKILEGPSFAATYAAGGGLTKVHPSLGDRFHQMFQVIRLFSGFVPLAVVLLWLTIVGQWRQPRENWHPRRLVDIPHASLTRVVAVIAVVATCASLMVLVPIFPHYAYLLVAGMILTTFLVTSVSPSPQQVSGAHTGSWLRSSLASVAIVSLAYVITAPIIGNKNAPARIVNGGGVAWQLTGSVFSRETGLLERFNLAENYPLSLMCPAGSKVLVWGWGPELYAQYDWLPATRYVVTSMQVTDFTTNTRGYRARLLADFHSEKPLCVVDAWPLFPFINLQLEFQWPEFAAKLDASYSRQEATYGGPQTIPVWVRTEP